MNTAETLFVGVKGHVVAFNKLDGGQRWRTRLKGGFLSAAVDFVTVLVEGNRIYAHTAGELFCLDAATGQQLWNNKMEGLGFDIASLAIEGISAPSAEIRGALLQKQRAANNSGTQAAT